MSIKNTSNGKNPFPGKKYRKKNFEITDIKTVYFSLNHHDCLNPDIDMRYSECPPTPPMLDSACTLLIY